MHLPAGDVPYVPADQERSSRRLMFSRLEEKVRLQRRTPPVEQAPMPPLPPFPLAQLHAGNSCAGEALQPSPAAAAAQPQQQALQPPMPQQRPQQPGVAHLTSQAWEEAAAGETRSESVQLASNAPHPHHRQTPTAASIGAEIIYLSEVLSGSVQNRNFRPSTYGSLK